jgi:F0F1-type ATP synthase membrane subunit b/b'
MSDLFTGHEEAEALEPMPVGGVEEHLDELIDIISTAKAMPLSASVLINREEALDAVEAARNEFPEELRRARRLLKDREEVLAAARREAAEIIEDARVHAERMVQRTEIVRQAEHRAVRLVEDAEAECRRLRHEADDYIDQKLAAFEIVLDRTMRTVRAGRERLAAVPTDHEPDAAADQWFEGGAAAGGGAPTEGFFDQDVE